MATMVGKQIGNYEILEEIGRGAMGVVFKARQVSMDRIVALKFLPKQMAQDEKRVQRFIREAHAAGKLSHPHIVHVHDVGSLEGYHYISMEFVDGTTAHKKLHSKGPFSEAECVELGVQIAGALKEAHNHGILHRDIKPDNFLMDKQGRARLADLGLARFEDKNNEEQGHLTQDGTALGTPHYMAPEQARGAELDARADLYGLGASLYTLSSGRTPFEGKTPAAIMVQVISQAPPDLDELREDLSPGFVAVVMKLLEKEPAKRFQSAQELIEALEKVKAGEYLPKGAGTGRAGRVTTGKVGRVTTGQAARVRAGKPAGEAVREGGSGAGLYIGLGAAAVAVVGALVLFGGKSGGTPQAKPPKPAGTEVVRKPEAAPAVPVKPQAPAADASKPAFEALSARHADLLARDPATLAGAWEQFLAAHPQAASKSEAQAKLAEARDADERQKSAWTQAEQASREALAAGRHADAHRALQSFLEAHGSSALAAQARAQQGQVEGAWQQVAQEEIDKSRAAAQSGETAAAKGMLSELKDKLPAALAEKLELPARLKELEDQEAAIAAKVLQGHAADKQRLAAAHTQAEAKVRHPETRFAFALAQGVYRQAADEMKTQEGKLEAAQWSERYLRAQKAWETAAAAVKAGKKPKVESIGRFKGGVELLGWEERGLRCDPAGLPAGQIASWKDVTPEQAVQVARTGLPDAPTPDQTLDVGLFAFATGAWKPAIESLEAACQAKGDLHALADEPIARAKLGWEQEREGLAKAALAAAQAAFGKQDAPGVKAGLDPLTGEGELSGTAYAKEQAAEIKKLSDWLAQAAVPAEGAAAAGGDAKSMLQQLGWAVVEGEWSPDPKKKGNFLTKGGKLELPIKDGAVDVTVNVKPETKVSVWVRYDAEFFNKLPEKLELPEFMRGGGDRTREMIRNAINGDPGDGYGVRITGGEATIFGVNDRPDQGGDRGPRGGRGGRFGGGPGGGGFWGRVTELAKQVPVEKERFAVAPTAYRVLVNAKDEKLDIQVGDKTYRATSGARTEGKILIQVEGEAEISLPKVAKH
ncbi:MAG: hypothetical protein AMXMBFR7_10770 [Planctomycetota bacterium]